MERETGFEPATPSLEGWRSTTELFPRLGSPGARSRPGCRPTPLSFAPPGHARKNSGGRPTARPAPTSRPPTTPRWWRGEDLNPRRRSPADLQSAPFGHLGTSPCGPWTPVGLAPPADGRRWLQTLSGLARTPHDGAGEGNRTPDLLLTRQPLYP